MESDEAIQAEPFDYSSNQHLTTSNMNFKIQDDEYEEDLTKGRQPTINLHRDSIDNPNTYISTNRLHSKQTMKTAQDLMQRQQFKPSSQKNEGRGVLGYLSNWTKNNSFLKKM